MPEASRGVFITLEGGEGSGKSTQARILTGHLRDNGYLVCSTEEPMGTPLGRAIKELFERQAESADVLATGFGELFLFEAARSQHVRDVIRPALDRGEIVVCDRFADSTTAYQGYGRGLNLREVETCNHIATEGLEPDLTLLLDLDSEVGLKRAEDADCEAGEAKFRIHADPGLHERVRDGYLEIAKQSRDRVQVVDAGDPIDDVTRATWATIVSLLNKGG